MKSLTGLELLQDRWMKAMGRWENAFSESSGRMTLFERHMSRLAYAAYDKYMTAKEEMSES